MLTLVDVLKRTELFLGERGIEAPRFEAELLLCHVLELQRLQLYLSHDRPLLEKELSALRSLVARRGQREPMAWILGSVGFHEIELEVRAGVLVPRPDTETLVEAALGWLTNEDPTFVVDVGCGTGCVGLAIAAARPGVRLYAVDIDPVAIETARANVARLALTDRVAVLRGSLLEPVPEQRQIDWVVSNPPYIPSADIPTLMPEVSLFEPRPALDGGGDGLDVYRVLLPQAARRARQGVLVEVGIGQAAAVCELFRRAGLTGIETFDDLGGVTRVVAGRCTV